MSSERRHQLEHNELAVWLAKVNKAIEPYSKLIAVGIIVLVVVLVSWSFLSSEGLAKRSDATLQLIQAANKGDAEVLMLVSDTYPDTKAGSWARLYQGQQLLAEGMEQLYQDRDAAEILLTDAKQALLSAAASGSDALLASRAHYGVAQACEALGEIDDAKEAYGRVIAVNESEEMVNRASDRVAALDKPETKDFLAWFGEQDFSAPDPAAPPPLPTGNALPPVSDFEPPTLDLGLGGGDTKTPEGGLELPEGVTAPDEKGGEESSDNPPAEAEAQTEQPAEASEGGDAAEDPVVEADASAGDESGPTESNAPAEDASSSEKSGE